MTKKSKRLYILNNEEIDALYSLPKFNTDEREIFFELTESETLAFNKIIDIPTKIHFVLQLGYFKAKLRLFNYNYRSVSNDLKFIIARFFPDIKSNKTLLAKAQKLENNKIILSLLEFHEYEDKIRSKVLEHLISIARKLICHITICGELITYFNINKIVIPQYTVMQDLISFAIKIEEIRLTNKIEQSLTNELNLLLEKMLTTQEKLGLNSFKKFPRDFKYRALKTEVNKGENFRKIYFFAKEFLDSLEISEYNIRYYALIAEEYNISQLKKIKASTAKLFLLCYIYYRYQQINDNLVICYNYYTDKFNKEAKAYAIDELVKKSKTHQANVSKVSKLLRFMSDSETEKMNHQTFYQEAYTILPKGEYIPTADYLEGNSFDENQAKWDYYVKISNRIKKYYRPIFKHLDLSFESEKMPIIPSIKFLKKELNKSKISLHKIASEKIPVGFIPKSDRKYLLNQKTNKDDKDTYDPSKYEAYTYFSLSKAIHKGKIYCSESVKHKSLKEDLVSDEIWNNKEKLLAEINYKNIGVPIEKRLATLGELLDEKILKVNDNIENGTNKYFKKDGDKWHLKYAVTEEEINHRFFNEIKNRTIVDIIHFASKETDFLECFSHLRTKNIKQKAVDDNIIACIIANGLGFGIYNISQTSDLNINTLTNHEKNFIRVDVLKKANDKIVNKIGKLGIFHKWKLLEDKLLGGLDGIKYETKYYTTQSRDSPKYFGLKKGVVSLGFTANHAVINSKIISPNEHESHFIFDLSYNNTSEIDPDVITGDMASINGLNYVALDAISKLFAPNINNPQNETIISLKPLKTYDNCFVKPSKVANQELIKSEWDNIQRILYSLIAGKTTQSIIVGKLSSSKRNSRTKKALSELNEIFKSLHLLEFIDNNQHRSAIRKALNRTESFNKLRRAITKIGGGKFIGSSPRENEIWNQCTRLIANCIIYYNAVLIDQVLQKLEAEGKEALFLEYIKNVSPIAWIHINLTGKYEFTNEKTDINIEEIARQLKEALNDKDLFKKDRS